MLPLQLSHPPNKRKKSFSSRFGEDVITEHIGIHKEGESLNLKASYFEIIDTTQSKFSHRFSEFNLSLIKSLRALLPASNCFLDKEELQPLCSLVNSTTKSISEDLLDAETTIVKSIVSSKLPGVLFNENIRMNLDQFLKWFSKYKAAFPTTYLYLLLSAGLTIRVSTATCEKQASPVWRGYSQLIAGAWHTIVNVNRFC